MKRFLSLLCFLALALLHAPAELGLKFVDLAARQALIDYVRTGKGVIGIHSATDNFPTWEPGQALLGGKFDGHPWGAGDIEAVKVDDPAHPVVAPFGGKGFWINDE